MAEYRQIHTRIWKDNWFCDLSDAGKLLFIYLFSNERASVSGIYELPLKYIVFETGIPKADVESLLKEFENAGKVKYENGIIWVVNLRKYNESASPKVITRLNKDIAAIPDSNILRIYCQHYQIQYPYSMDTTSEIGERNGNGNGNRNGNRNGEREGEGEDTPPLSEFAPPEIAIVHEVTGLLPDISNEPRIINNIQTCRKRLHNPPRDLLLAELTTVYKQWCETKTRDGRLYNPSNWDWTERAATGYTPAPPTVSHVRMLKGADGALVEDR